MSDDDTPTGVPPLVAAVAQAIKETHKETTAHATEVKNAQLTQWLEAFEAEHAGFMQGLLQAALDHPDMPPEVKTALGSLVAPEHQTAVILGLFSVGSIVSRFVGAAIAPLAQDVSNVAWHGHPSMPLSPAELAIGVLKGWLDQGAAADDAKLSGINNSNFDLLTKITGEPPGPQQLGEALRRNIIDRGRFEKGIRESRVRPEWIDVLEALRFSPLGFGTIVAAAVEGHITLEELAHRLELVGIEPKEAQLVYETAGRPPGVFELSELVNRGEMPEALWLQAIRESDIKNKYIPLLAKLRRKIPPMRTVVAAVHQGVLSPARAIEKLHELGYNQEDAAMLVSEATALKHGADKQLAMGMIRDLYSNQLIDRAKAHSLLTGLGYDDTETGFILSLADHARHYRYQAAGITRIHSLYTAHRLSRHQVGTSLDGLGVPSAAREDFLKLWDEERKANVPRLSLAQLQGGLRRQVISADHWKTRVLEMGYAETDLPILWAESWPPTQKAPEYPK